MLLMRVRERPCRLFAVRLSSGRATTTFAPSIVTVMGSVIVRSSWPFGPLTATFWPCAVTVTPWGTGIGFFPIRDMVVPLVTAELPDAADELAADALFTGRTVGHDAAARRENRD